MPSGSDAGLMRVLVADDDPVLRFALRQHLERWSFDVLECLDGHEAWQAMQEPSPPMLMTASTPMRWSESRSTS